MNLQENLDIEYKARIKYQDLVYKICGLFDTSKEKCTIDIVYEKVKQLSHAQSSERTHKEVSVDELKQTIDISALRNTANLWWYESVEEPEERIEKEVNELAIAIHKLGMRR